jgi:butyryl-CoA dehydrogenase
MRNDLLNEMVEEFSKTYVKPLAKSVDEEERFPEETVELLGKYGLLGLPFPKEFGGVGADTKAYIDTVRTISKDCATTGVIISAHTSLCASPIFMFGSEAQKNKYLTKLNKGEYLGAFGLTEPGAGTDASQQQTKAIDFGDYYELTGSKIFITNAGYADVYIIFAMTQPELGLKGISAFIVEKDIKGFTVGPKEKKMGIKGSSTCELIFQKAKIPKENLLGKEGQGFKIAMQTLDGGRIGIAAQALGIAEGAFERAVSYVKTRTQFNRPLSKFQNTQFVIADLKTQIEAARGLLYQAVADKDENRNYTLSAAMAKLYCSKVAVEVSDKTIQLMGGYGYIRDYEVERYLRDAKITEIYEGTSEVQRMVIAGKVLA